jgi:archaemetzincin
MGTLIAVVLAVAALREPQASSTKCVIALAPVGDTSLAMLPQIRPAVAETFGCEVAIAPAVPLPASAWSTERKQYLSTAILDSLARVKQPRWERLLGIADVDLYVPQLNFVFGEGDSRRGVAVFSLARLHGSDELFRKRATTEAIHELGHTYGLSHCDDPHCVMWFSNTLAETDRKGTRLCSRQAKELADLRPARPKAPAHSSSSERQKR